MKNLSKIVLTGLILIAGIQATCAKAAKDSDWRQTAGAGIVAGIAFTGHTLINKNPGEAAQKIALGNAALIATTAGAFALSIFPIEREEDRGKPRLCKNLLFLVSTFYGIPITAGFVAGSAGMSGCALIAGLVKTLRKS